MGDTISREEIRKLLDEPMQEDIEIESTDPNVVLKVAKPKGQEQSAAAPKVLKDPYEKRHLVDPGLTNELPILKVENLVKKFKTKHALKNINLDIKKGEIFGIVGESGSGKTTFLKTIVGFLLPDGGSVQFSNRDILKTVHSNSKDAKLMFGFAAQDPSFYLKLTVQENIEHFGALYNLSKEERRKNAEKLLQLVNLYDARESMAVKLSGGMRRRLGLLTSTVHKPDIFVLDEPTADLDPFSRKLVINFIKHANEQGKTIIIASHLLEDIENLCDRVGVMYKGKMSMVATPDDLKKVYAKHKLVEVDVKPRSYDDIMDELKKTGLSFTDMYVENKKLYIKSESTEKLLQKLLQIVKGSGKQLIDINISRPTLSEIFEDICTE